MKHSTEENIIKLAFGELTPEESGRVQSQLSTDADGGRTLNLYERMREDLKELRSVPEPQFSADRLRDAILNESRVARSFWTRFGWLGLPAAAAAGFLAMSLINRPVADPKLVAGNFHDGGPTVKMEPILVVPSPTDKSVAINMSGAPKSSKTKPTLISRQRKISRHYGTPTLVALNKKQPSVEAVSKPIENNTTGASPMAMADAIVPAKDSDSIVLITGENDAETGSQRATEVNPANVAIGG